MRHSHRSSAALDLAIPHQLSMSTEHDQVQEPSAPEGSVLQDPLAEPSAAVDSDTIPNATHAQVENDSDEEEFVYPGSENVVPESTDTQVASPEEEPEEEQAEEFVYPGSEAVVSEPADTRATSLAEEQAVEEVEQQQQQQQPLPQLPAPAITRTPSRQNNPTPAQLESLYAAASSGDLELLKKLFATAQASGIAPFALSNDASSRTGFTALHAAASRGHLPIVQWLIEECGAIPDLEDKEGETALHKAALNGHLEIIQYLLPSRADVRAPDADGWTALHNACSKGYLDIVRWLCEQGRADAEVNGLRGVDMRSKGGWTPLMNAASKGHLPVVLYLLSKQSADPLIRNNWGETAYDMAAAVFEVWICEVLQRAEAEKWRMTTVPYNPIAVHTTVPLVLYENQRLDTRFKTLAVSGGKPKFSASGLGRPGRRAPWELRLPVADEDTREREIAAWRSSVQLPLKDSPYHLPLHEQPSVEGAERSHFWLSDWTLDITHPSVDAHDGWQYAHDFADPDDQWTAEQPPQLERLLTGTNLVAAVSPSSSRPQIRVRTTSTTSPSVSSVPQKWVRRRRWVRVMRRRLDIPPLPFLQPDGGMYMLADDGSLIPYVSDEPGDSNDHGVDGQEMGFLPSTAFSIAHQDYVSRARYIAGTQDSEAVAASSSAVEVRRAITKLERAISELRQGILGDTDAERKTQAEVLLNAYSRELERRRLDAGAQGLLSVDDDQDDFDPDADSSDEEFHYPGASPVETTRPPSVRSGTTDYFGRASSSRPTAADLTPQLSQAPEFRVPTHEAPQKMLTPRWTPHPLHAQWERDEAAPACRSCQRRFGFLLRRHCRKCGRIFCDRCSSYRALLDPSDVVQDPAFPEQIRYRTSHRVCQSCHDDLTATVPSGLHPLRNPSLERIMIDEGRLSVPHRSRSSSQISDLAECPVCNTNLANFGSTTEQEEHVKNCLDGGSSATPQAKYLVYRLPADSILVGIECVICLEEFVAGSMVARLSCLCSFHNTCLTSWLQRGRSCPVHAR